MKGAGEIYAEITRSWYIKMKLCGTAFTPQQCGGYGIK